MDRASPVRVAALLGALASVVLHGCSKGSPGGPDDGDTGQPLTAEIGPSGGEVSHEGFRLRVPARAFADTQSVTLQRVADGGNFGQATATGRYRLTGIPSAYSGKVVVSLECEHTPVPGTFIVVCPALDATAGDDSTAVFAPLPAVYESGYLTAEVVLAGPAESAPGPGKAAGVLAESFELLGLERCRYLDSPSGTFRLFCADGAIARTELLGQFLEESYRASVELGLYRYRWARIEPPILVDVSAHHPVLPSRCLGPGTLKVPHAVDEYGLVVCEEVLLEGSPVELRREAFEAIPRLYHWAYDPTYQSNRGEWNWLLEHADQLWLPEAFARWFGTRHVPFAAGTMPPYLVGHQLALVPLQGMRVPPGRLHWMHGDGMVGLLTYLADTYGPATVMPLALPTPRPGAAIDTLLSVVPDPEHVWWPGFMEKYLAGNILSVPTDTLLGEARLASADRVFVVGSDQDTLKTFTDTYADLSAKLYLIKLAYGGIDPDAVLELEVGPPTLNLDYVTVLLYGLKNHRLELLDKGTLLELSALKDLTDGGSDLVAAVVNSANQPPYTGTLAIDLTVRVRATTARRACIWVRAIGAVDYGGGSTPNPTVVQYGNPQRLFRGTLEGDLFTAQWDTLQGNKQRTGTMSIRFDLGADPVRVTYFRLDDRESWADSQLSWHFESSDACSIPGERWTDGYTFRVSGPGVITHLGAMDYRSETPPTVWWCLDGFSADADSFIDIELQ